MQPSVSGRFQPRLSHPRGGAALGDGRGRHAMFDLNGVMDVIRHAFALGVLVFFLTLVLVLAQVWNWRDAGGR